MAAITIDDTTRFVSVLSFTLDSTGASAVSREVQRTIEARGRDETGFIGSVVMMNAEKHRLSIVSIWESEHAWSAAQYDRQIGQAVSDAVEAAKSYDIETYDTLTVVRAQQAPS
jgi:heme-degrading monooxygenase HmoA